MRTRDPLAGLHVLVADPHAAMAEITSATLRSIGVGTVTKVINSHETMRALTESKFSVVVVADDLKPLGAVGLTTVLRDMQECSNRNVPVIAIGNAVYKSMLEEARQVGISRVISRPVSADILRKCLLSVLPAPLPDGDRAYL